MTGTVFDAENKLLGTIKSDGTVLNQNSEIIGFTPKTLLLNGPRFIFSFCFKTHPHMPLNG